MGSMGAVLTAIGRNVSFLGKTWWLLMGGLRLVLVLLAGFPLFSDEQERFVCNTIQPGCANVCFNLLAPVSPLRLWLLHLLLLCLPHLLLATHVAHRLLRDPDSDLDQDQDQDQGAGHARGCKGGSPCSSLDDPQLLLLHYHQHPPPPPHLHLHHCGGQAVAAERTRSVAGLRGAYLLAVAVRALLEAGFAAGHFLFFGLAVPPSFLCYEAPCASGVQCYVSRPTEKTLMLRLMLGLACVSVAMSLAELVGGARAALRRRRRESAAEEQEEEEMSKGEQSSAFSSLRSSEESHLLEKKMADGFESQVKAAPPYTEDRAPSVAVAVEPKGVADEKTSPWKHNRNGNGAVVPAAAAKPRVFVLHAQQEASEHAGTDQSPAHPGLAPCNPAGFRGPGPLAPPTGSAPSSRKNSNPSEAPDKRAWV